MEGIQKPTDRMANGHKGRVMDDLSYQGAVNCEIRTINTCIICRVKTCIPITDNVIIDEIRSLRYFHRKRDVAGHFISRCVSYQIVRALRDKK